jgi:membrane associated rhomboid family serine protease
MASRVTEIFSKIPFVTTSLLALNCFIHAIIFLFSLNAGEFAISADLVLDGEYYRVISAAFVHGGIMHIFMNMTSLLQLGASLEAQFGSAQFALMTLWSTLLIGAVYVLLSW